MAKRKDLSPAQEAQAQELATALQQLTRDELLDMARALVAGPPEAVFGAGEFELRDIAHKLAAKAQALRLATAPKKTSTPSRPA